MRCIGTKRPGVKFERREGREESGGEERGQKGEESGEE